MSLSTPATVCFVACHGGPADHFAAFAEGLTRDRVTVQVHATGAALSTLNGRQGVRVSPFSLTNLSSSEEDALARKIAKAHEKAAVLFTDVGHPFADKVQRAFALYAKNVRRIAYYDNPERYVPGGYSDVASKITRNAQIVAFANETLVRDGIQSAPGIDVDLSMTRRVGIGYYPVAKAEALFARRLQEHDARRKELFAKYGIVDQGQKLLVYFGANNEEYFTKAFPAFLSFLTEAIAQSDLSRFVILHQGHPGAKAENRDGKELTAWCETNKASNRAPKIVISDSESDIVQIAADSALYYQTSMGPQFVLEGIPTIQVAHETYGDILARANLCTKVTTANTLIDALSNIAPFGKEESHKDALKQALGVRADCSETVKKTIREIEVAKTVDALKVALKRAFNNECALRPKFVFQVSKMMQAHGASGMVSTLKYAYDSKDSYLRLSCATIAHTILKRSSDLNKVFLAEARSQLSTPALGLVRMACMQLSVEALTSPVYNGTFS